MMGGDIVVTSEEGVGSRFTISVPRECPEYAEDEVTPMLSILMIKTIWLYW